MKTEQATELRATPSAAETQSANELRETLAQEKQEKKELKDKARDIIPTEITTEEQKLQELKGQSEVETRHHQGKKRDIKTVGSNLKPLS